jgi:hypothetical protein
MDRFVKEAIEIKLRSDSISRQEGFKLCKVWNSSTSLLRHSNTYITKIPQRNRRACKKEIKVVS